MSYAMSVAWLVIAAVLLVAVTGCGTRQDEGSQATPTTETAPIDTVGESVGIWQVDMAQPPLTKDTPPLANQLSVFTQEGRAEDRIGIEWETPPLDTAPGKEEFDRSRLLIRSTGPILRFSLYGVPTTKGWVCPWLEYNNGSEPSAPCWHSLRAGIAFSLDGWGGVYRLYGVAADDVTKVTVASGGTTYQADMGRNAFSLEMKTAVLCPADIERVVARHADGTTSTIELSEVAPPLDRDGFDCA